MNYMTHTLGGVAAGLTIISTAGIHDPIQKTTVMTGAVLGSLFADIDHPKSWITHKVPVAGTIISGLFKHRGFLHTPLFIVITWAFVSILIPMWIKGPDDLYRTILFFNGFIPGMLSHLILDTLNVQGIMWLFPISTKRINLLSIRTGGFGEAVICAVLGAMLFGQYKGIF
ncbi:MAG: metal-dependent hydrolase [Anaerovorax sp.]|nr:metal-dependent hydrolase [Anaerovorax sp.]